jgi:hypothetical protein
MRRAAHISKIDANRSKLERIAADRLKFEIPTGNLEKLWAEAEAKLLSMRTKLERAFQGEDAWEGVDEAEAEAAKIKELDGCAAVVQLVQEKFHACAEAQAELEDMRQQFAGELAKAVGLLTEVRGMVAVVVKDNDAVGRALSSAELAVKAATKTLEGHDVNSYNLAVRTASQAISDARSTIKAEELAFTEGVRRKEGYEVLVTAKRRHQEVGTLVDTHMLRGNPAVQIGSAQCDDALSMVNSLEASGTADEFVRACEKYDQYVTYYTTTYHSEKTRVEQQRRDRAVELAKLQPAMETLHGLTTKLEVSTLPDEALVGNAIMEAAHECDVVKAYLDTCENVAVARGRVSDAIKHVAAAERLFNDAVRKQNAINKELAAASKALEVANRRLASLMQNVEHAGSTVAQLVEERVAEAEAMISDAKRAIRKGDQVGGLVAAVEAALMRVDDAEETLTRAKQRVATVERARGRAALALEVAINLTFSSPSRSIFTVLDLFFVSQGSRQLYNEILQVAILWFC